MTLCPVRLDIDGFTISSPPQIDFDLIKTHAAIDAAEFNDLLDVYFAGAVAWAEGATHRTIFARAHRWVLRDFPRNYTQSMRLPRGKTQSVASIAYVSGGQTLTLKGPTSSTAGTDYQEDLRGDDGGLIMPPQGEAWPSVDFDVPAPVVVTFTAGWLANEVPKDIVHAIMFAITDAFEIRTAADLSANGKTLNAREALISQYRLIRWY